MLLPADEREIKFVLEDCACVCVCVCVSPGRWWSVVAEGGVAVWEDGRVRKNSMLMVAVETWTLSADSASSPPLGEREE